MKIIAARGLILALVMGLCQGAVASPLSDYNLILLGDYNFQGGDVHGRAFIGGDINAQGMAVEFGSRVPKDPAGDTLELAGNLYANNTQMQSGYLVHGGSLSGNINCNGGFQGCTRASSELDAKTEQLRAQLQAESSGYAGLASSGDFVSTQGSVNPNTFSYTGAGGLAVFNLAAEDVFKQNNSLMLQAGSAETVIFNISGLDILFGGGVNLTNGFGFYADSQNIGASNILWNFYEATRIDFGHTGMVGSVLAPYADLFGGNNFDGSVAAQSYTGGREFHDFAFVPPPPVSVNESSLLVLMLMGLGLLGLRRLR